MTFLIRAALVVLLACGAAHAHDAPPPARPEAALRVAVSGAVQQPLSLGVDDLRRFPADQIVTLTLPGRQAGAPSSVLKGVRLRAVLEQARLVAVTCVPVRAMSNGCGRSR